MSQSNIQFFDYEFSCQFNGKLFGSFTRSDNFCCYLMLLLTDSVKKFHIYIGINQRYDNKKYLLMEREPATKPSYFEDIVPSHQSWLQVHLQQHHQLEGGSEKGDALIDSDDDPLSESYQLSWEFQELLSPGTQTSLKTRAAPKEKALGYQKNICSYVTKIIVKAFVGQNYKAVIQNFCQKVGCKIQEALKYYRGWTKKLLGKDDLSKLLIPEDEEEAKIKRVFFEFMLWFLRHKYTVYLVQDGKMSKKWLYLAYKNRYFLYIDQEIKQFFQTSTLNRQE